MASPETFTAESDTGKKRTMSHTLLIRYMQCGPTLSRYREVGADVRTVLRLDSETAASSVSPPRLAGGGEEGATQHVSSVSVRAGPVRPSHRVKVESRPRASS